MSRATLKAVVDAAVAPEGTFTVPYTSQAQADFVDGQTVTLEVYGRAVSFTPSFGGSAATLTWDAGETYDLPVGEYYIDFDLDGGDELANTARQAGNLPDSVAATVEDLVTDHNLLLTALKDAGLMEADEA